MKSIAIIGICLILSQACHMQSTETCTDSVNGLIASLQKTMSDIKGGNNIFRDLIDMGTQVSKIISNCPNHKSGFTNFLAADECVTDVNGIIALVPQIIAHVKAKSFVEILGDVTSIKKILDHFSANCVNKSTDCTSELATIGANAHTLIGDIQAKNQVKVKSDVSGLIDQAFDYEGKCLGPQTSFEYLTIMSKVFEQKMNFSQFFATSSCDTDFNGIFAEIPVLIGHVTSGNVLALLGDYTTFSGYVKDFKDNCENSSAACVAKRLSIGTMAVSVYNDVRAKDQASAHTHADAMVDTAFDYFNTCTGPQTASRLFQN